MSRQALELALEALEDRTSLMKWQIARDAVKEALAQPEQEPVAWMLEGWGPDCGPYFEIYRDDEMGWRNKKEWTPLYTTPPQRKPLTDEDINDIAKNYALNNPTTPLHFARAIEAAHGIKE